MTRIECNCKTCKANAAKIGKSAPLAAMVPQILVDKGQIATAKGRHGLVYYANEPGILGEVSRKRMNITAA